jgi:hypothetical protein
MLPGVDAAIRERDRHKDLQTRIAGGPGRAAWDLGHGAVVFIPTARLNCEVTVFMFGEDRKARIVAADLDRALSQ